MNPRFLLKMLIDRAKTFSPEAKNYFERISASGQVMTPLQRFSENLFACAYTQTPDGYLKFNETKVGDVADPSHERTFFETLQESTSFAELRASTVRNLPVALSACIDMVDAAWSAYNNYRTSKETGYLEEDGEPTSEDDLNRSIRSMLKDAAKNAQDLKEVIGLIGGKKYGIFPSENEGQLPDKETADALALMKASGPLRGIIEMLGRVHRVREHAITDVIRSGSIVPHRIELGADIPQILPAELAIGRRLRALFLAQFAEGGLLMDGLGQPEHRNCGGIIVICDETGSMSFDNRIIWAKSIAACMYLSTKESGRPFRYYPLGITLGDERCDLPGILRSSHSYGATDIPATLKSFRKKFDGTKEGEEIGLKSADVVLITDGDSPAGDGVAENFKAFKAKYGFRLLSIVIGAKGQDPKTTVTHPYSNKQILTGSDPSVDLMDTQQVFNWAEGE